MNAEGTPTGSEPTRPPQKPGSPLAVLLPLVLGIIVLGGVFYVATRPGSDTDTTGNSDTSGNTVSTPRPGAQKTPAPVATPAVPPKFDYSFTLFLPNDNGELVKKNATVELSKLVTQRKPIEEAVVAHAVRELLKAAPDDFPKGTRLKDVKLKDGVLLVDFNRNFADPNFYQGSTRTLATIYSVVNTAALATGPQPQGSTKGLVRLQVDGKSLEVLGEMDLSEPLKRNDDLVAQS